MPEASDKDKIQASETKDKTPTKLSRGNLHSPLGILSRIDNMMREFHDRFLDEPFFRWSDESFPVTEFRRPVTGMTATEDAYIFRSELPGLSADEIDMEVDDDGFLTIKGEREEEVEEEGYFRKESRKFYRKIALPRDASFNKDIEATVENGLLDVKVKRKKPNKKKVKVKDKNKD
ncbi:Hsp20 family protein [Candidatus Bathyarchaeota archaeon]|nr:Hsp20 family protein [Candidatus Bathyarchaeota archaeon]